MKISWKDGKLTVSRAVKKHKSTAKTIPPAVEAPSVLGLDIFALQNQAASAFQQQFNQQRQPFAFGQPFGPPPPTPFPFPAPGGLLPTMPTITPEVSAKSLENTRQAMIDVLEVAACQYAKDSSIKAKTDGDKVQVGPLLMDWQTIDEATASKDKFGKLLGGLFEALDDLEAKKAKLPRQVPAQRATLGGGARWSPR